MLCTIELFDKRYCVQEKLNELEIMFYVVIQ